MGTCVKSSAKGIPGLGSTWQFRPYTDLAIFEVKPFIH